MAFVPTTTALLARAHTPSAVRSEFCWRRPSALLTRRPIGRSWRLVPVDCAPPDTETASRPLGDLDFIKSGPVFRRAELEADIDWDKWAECADWLTKELGDQANADRVHRYYLPVYFWLRKLLDEKRRSSNGKALTVGLSCPQGGGKTSLTTYLEMLFARDGMNIAVASTDDFYLTRDDQKALASRFPSNTLLETRGNPGTMDLNLCLETIEHLRSAKAGETILVPRYDKSAFNGLGDRRPQENWSFLRAPVDVVVLEGWCMGFQPVPQVDFEDLEPVNKFLGEFDAIYALLDAMLVVQIDDVQWVYRWRQQAEDEMAAKGRPGMTREQLQQFVDRFMPAYRNYLPGLYMGSDFNGMPQLRIRINENRVPVD